MLCAWSAALMLVCGSFAFHFIATRTLGAIPSESLWAFIGNRTLHLGFDFPY